MGLVDAPDLDRTEELVAVALDGVVAILDAVIADCEQMAAWAGGAGGADEAAVAGVLVTLRDLRACATEMR